MASLLERPLVLLVAGALPAAGLLIVVGAGRRDGDAKLLAGHLLVQWVYKVF